MTDDMQKALEADGEKLRQLTGEDHGPFHDLPRHTTDWQFQRGEDTVDVLIHYDIEPYVPAIVSGPADNWSPAEGGCVTDLVAFKAGTQEMVELTVLEREEVADWIERNHDHDEDRYGDPDAAYDAWRDDQMDRRDDAGWDD
jgi:hypothetical protein